MTLNSRLRIHWLISLAAVCSLVGGCATKVEKSSRAHPAEINFPNGGIPQKPSFESDGLGAPYQVTTGNVLVPRERTFVFTAENAAGLVRAVSLSPPDGITGYWIPADSDLAQIDDALLEYRHLKKWERKRNWGDFYRQVAGIYRGNQKLIFVYYFAIEPSITRLPDFDLKKLKHTPFVFYDGGDDYFRIFFDVATKHLVWYESNGIAGKTEIRLEKHLIACNRFD